jgi:hypothetical protein
MNLGLMGCARPRAQQFSHARSHLTLRNAFLTHNAAAPDDGRTPGWPLRFMSPMRVQCWRSKLSMNLKVGRDSVEP